LEQFCLSFFRADIGVEKDSALSPILSILYIALIFHIFEKKSKKFLSPITVSLFSFVDDSLFFTLKNSVEDTI